MAKESDQHHLLPGNSDDSDDDVEFSQGYGPGSRREKELRMRRLATLVFAIVLLLAANIASFWVGTCFSMRKSSLDAACAAHTTHWSPLLNDVSITYSEKKFEGSFFHENIYRQKASPEVDKAWEDLGVDTRPGIIRYEDGKASGLDDSFLHRSDKYGGGFIVNVEGMHHLHCLNLLRKALYYNYDYYKKLGMGAFKNEEYVVRPHVTHCLDMLRQVLMCNVDTGVLGQVWVNTSSVNPFTDFNTRHTCKNFDAVRKWAKKIELPPQDKLPQDFSVPPRPEYVLQGIP